MDHDVQPTERQLAQRLRLTDPRLMFGIVRTRRDVVTSLWMLDARLDAQIGATQEPALAQIRLRWWRDELLKLQETANRAASQPDPLIAALAADPCGPADMLALTDIWDDLLLSRAGDAAEISALAVDRGRLLFGASARRAGAAVGLEGESGAIWGLIDLALHPRYRRTADHLLTVSATMPLAPHATGSLALLDRWARRVAVRQGRAAPLRDAAWFFVHGWRLAAPEDNG